MQRSSSSEERQYTLQELATSASVSIRTIRYYIGEGLLPAPEGAGSQSYYTESHRRRLLAIGLLKDRFLPLREIRTRLAGLDDDDIEELIARLGDHEESDRLDIVSSSPPVHDTAIDYIDTVLKPQRASSQSKSENHRRRRTPTTDSSERWRRIVVADGAELLVREDIYRRRKDQIDWLVDWARKVVD